MSDDICPVEGCEKRRATHGRLYCGMHAARLARHGNVHAVREVKPRLRTNGYMHVRAAGHPLVGRYGTVAVHRRVLFDALHGDDAPCHWCGKDLHWFPVKGQARMTVDHLDWDRTNNDLSNLVPSCGPCNTRRPQVVRRGEALHSSTLTENDVREIRASHLTYVELAAIYGVNYGQIGRVKRGEQWKHLLPDSA